VSGYVTIPRALAVAARESARVAKTVAGPEGQRRHSGVALDLSAHLEASARADAGDPAANDTRPDPELLAALCEAVRVQGLTVHATLYSPANPTTTGRHVLEVEPLLPVLAIPAHGSSVTLTSGARGRVMFPPHHEANAVKIKLAVMGRGEE
jgi:hypothetical protein